MSKNRWLGIVVGLVFFAQSLLFFVLPSLGAGVFLSPDETAVAVSARSFGTQASMRIEDKLLSAAPWLHPRSFVTQGESMVPVGFLGMPLVLGGFWRLFGDLALVLFTPLLVLSVVYPLWRLLARYGRTGQVVGVLTWLSFPTVILYANRGLFPNLPVVCLTVWAAYLLWEKRTIARAVLSGLCVGLALAIRPVEALWLLAWVALGWRLRQDRRPHKERIFFMMFLASCLLMMVLAALVAWRTYGAAFVVGYFLRDPIPSGTLVMPSASVSSWPFGLHPRDVLFNLKGYLAGFMGPWFIVSLVAGYVLLRNRLDSRLRGNDKKLIVGVAVWTLIVVAAMYGEAIYQDHVGINILSVGNSFLRYALPLSVIFALSAGVAASWFEKKWSVRGRMAAYALAVVLVLLGSWTAMVRDDEGIIPNAVELQRYALIRGQTREQAGPQSIVLSERSDKVFFPTFRAVSPLPAPSLIRPLAAIAPVPVLLYSSTLDNAHLAPWTASGITLRPIFQSQNETLYEMIATSTGDSP